MLVSMCDPDPNGHFVTMMLQAVVTMEQSLKYAYVMLFFMNSGALKGWRHLLLPCERYVEELKGELDMTNMDVSLGMEAGYRTQKTAEYAQRFKQQEAKLASIRDAKFGRHELVPLELLDSGDHTAEFTSSQDATHGDGVLYECCYCFRKGFAQDKLVHHVLAEHMQDDAPRLCPICDMYEDVPLVVHLMERHPV